MQDWKIILISVLCSAVCAIAASLISYRSARVKTRAQFEADLEKIREQVKESVRKQALLEKQKAYKDVIECILQIYRFKGESDEKRIRELQAKMNDIVARIYVFSSDDVVRQMNAFLLLKDKEKEISLRELILTIRGDIYPKTDLAIDDVVYPNVYRKTNH